jgi:FixJ family two-component response regulator
MVLHSAPRIRVLEPNQQLRSAILSLLAAEQYQVDACDTLEQVLDGTDESLPTVALVAWQRMDGLLAEAQRNHLSELTRRLRLIVMVPRRWAPLLESTDLGAIVAGFVSKPFEADELLDSVKSATASYADVM